MTSTIRHKDAGLINSLREGSAYAFECIFKKYYAPLYVYAKQYVDEESARNTVQDIMMWVWENRASLPEDLDLHNYLYRSVRNKCLTWLNHLSIRQRVHTVMERILSASPQNYEMNYSEELQAGIESALQKLPPTYRQAVVMNRIEGKTFNEIASELNVSVKTVEYRMKNGIQRLRVLLKEFL